MLIAWKFPKGIAGRVLETSAVMYGQLGDSCTVLLAVSRFVIAVNCFFALVIAGSLAIACACYCSLRTFSNFCFSLFRHSPVSLCLKICETEDTSLTRNRFPSKIICVLQSDSALSPLWRLDAEACTCNDLTTSNPSSYLIQVLGRI